MLKEKYLIVTRPKSLPRGLISKKRLITIEIFSPVVRPTTVWTVLSFAVSHGWPILLLDVQNAFLRDVIQEEVYMSQPPSYVDPTLPNDVYKLHESLYVLKQSSHVWYHRLMGYLIENGSTCSSPDSSVCRFQKFGY